MQNDSIKQWLNKYPDSTVEEMRAIRRELINQGLQMPNGWYKTLAIIKGTVRFYERINYGQELKAYA